LETVNKQQSGGDGLYTICPRLSTWLTKVIAEVTSLLVLTVLFSLLSFDVMQNFTYYTLVPLVEFMSTNAKKSACFWQKLLIY